MMAARTPSPLGSPPVSPLSPRGMPRYEVLFESYLQKTPPLEKLFVVSHTPQHTPPYNPCVLASQCLDKSAELEKTDIFSRQMYDIDRCGWPSVVEYWMWSMRAKSIV